MPTYAYHCSSCQKEHEIFQKITDEAKTCCPECGKNSLKRGPGGGIGLAFKGSGFYITDYANSSSCQTKASTGCCPCKD